MDLTEETIHLAARLLASAEADDQQAVVRLITNTTTHVEIACILAVAMSGGVNTAPGEHVVWDSESNELSEDETWVVDFVAATVEGDDDTCRALVTRARQSNSLIQCLGTLAYSAVATIAAESGGVASPSSR